MGEIRDHLTDSEAVYFLVVFVFKSQLKRRHGGLRKATHTHFSV